MDDPSDGSTRRRDSGDGPDLDCSRNTVRRYLKDPNATRYQVHPPRPVKLDPFKPYLLERVAAATPDWIPAAVLYRELQERGYEAG